jgi:hypothetical protein
VGKQVNAAGKQHWKPGGSGHGSKARLIRISQNRHGDSSAEINAETLPAAVFILPGKSGNLVINPAPDGTICPHALQNLARLRVYNCSAQYNEYDKQVYETAFHIKRLLVKGIH